MPAGTSQGKHLSSESPLGETLPVLSGSFIAGCRTAGFFLLLCLWGRFKPLDVVSI